MAWRFWPAPPRTPPTCPAPARPSRRRSTPSGPRPIRRTTGIGLNYQAIGSGGGIKQIKAKTVDFGASDKPLKPDDLNADGLMQFPTVIGGVVPVVNLPGVAPGEIKLTGALLADIYLGEIKKWNDPRIAKLNPGVPLPNLPITVVHRSDGSGTSFLFTTYLSHEEPDWAAKVGGNDVGAMADRPRRQGQRRRRRLRASRPSGSIGYVEYAYAKQNKMTYALMQNKPGGNFVVPDGARLRRRRAGADWTTAPGFYLLLLDQPGANSLADHRRHLHPGVQAAGQRRQGRRRAEVLRLGLQERRQRRRRSWTTCRCRQR